MNKKTFIVASLVCAAIILSTVTYSFASSTFASKEEGLFKKISESVNKIHYGPDGQEIKPVPIAYNANNDKDNSKFKKPEELKGYLSKSELSKLGAKYLMKELMTYEECVDKGYSQSIQHDVDGARMVWVIQLKYNRDVEVDPGRSIKKPVVTCIYDAESGDKINVWMVAENYIP